MEYSILLFFSFFSFNSNMFVYKHKYYFISLCC